MTDDTICPDCSRHTYEDQLCHCAAPACYGCHYQEHR